MPKLFAEGRFRNVLIIVLLAIGQAISAGIVAFSTRDIFAAFASSTVDIPFVTLTIFVIAGFMIAALRIAEKSNSESVGQSYAASLRKELFVHISQMDPREVSQMRAGPLSMRFVGDLTVVRAWVSAGVAKSISSMVILPGAIITLIMLNETLALVAVVPILVSLLVMTLAASGLGLLHRRVRSKRGRLAADMSERILIAPELRLLGRNRKEINRLNISSRSLRDAAVKRIRAYATLRAIPDCGISAAGGLLLYVALTSNVATSEAAAALAILGIIALPLRDFAGILNRYTAWQIARDKCLVILKIPTSPNTSITNDQDKKSAVPIRVKFDDVSAGGLRKVSITALPGQKILITGNNGSGKSSLLSLAAGLTFTQLGKVLLDEKDICSTNQLSLQTSIAYLGPSTPILKGSLRKAFTLGVLPRPSDEVIVSTAETYDLGGLIGRLGGLDGKVSEAGRNLSTGEMRRILLVRTKLKQPRLLLLDDPANGLDAKGCELVKELIHDINATVLVASHCYNLISACDKLWYLEQGVVWEYSSPDKFFSQTDFFKSKPQSVVC